MARKGGNPDIVELGKATRFKAGADNSAAKLGARGRATQQNTKLIREYIEQQLATEAKDGAGNVKQLKEGLSAVIVKQALAGNPKFVELLLKIIGEYPVEQVAMTLNSLDTSALDELEKVVLNDTRKSD